MESSLTLVIHLKVDHNTLVEIVGSHLKLSSTSAGHDTAKLQKECLNLAGSDSRTKLALKVEVAY